MCPLWVLKGTGTPGQGSDVNKATRYKDLGGKGKTMAKDLGFNIKAKAKNFGLKAKAKAMVEA